MSRLLVLTRHSPLPADDGAGSYLFQLLSYLRKQGCEIQVVWFEPHGELTRRAWCIVPAEIAAVFELRLPGSVALGRLRLFPNIYLLPWKARLLDKAKQVLVSLGLFPTLARWRGRTAGAGETSATHVEPRHWMSFPHQEEHTFATRCAEAFQPDAVLANFCWMNELFDSLGSRAPLRISLTHDVAHHRAAFISGASLTETEEARLLSKADVIVAISEADAEVFRELCRFTEVLVAPKAADARERLPSQVPGHCLFVGSCNEPNREGLAWFLEEGWPLVRSEYPEAELHVCGTICKLVTGEYAGVSFHGRVDNLDEYYQRAQAVLVPLLHGSGVKVKLVEACAFGKACVTTPVGLRGLPFLADHVLTAGDAATFAAAILRLFRDATLRETLESGSFSATQRELSETRCYGPIATRVAAGPTTAPAAAPRVSVVMPVFNAERYLMQAVESVLAQSFRQFEFIIVDDGSTDASPALLRGFEARDPRIRVISRANTGIVGALNDGLAAARGEFIARMDADDVSLPMRLERQVAFLDAHPECVAVGTDVLFIDPEGAPLLQRKPALQHREIVAELLNANGGALIHPSVVLRASAVVACGGYREQHVHIEDLDLYLRLMSRGELANLPEALLLYRQHVRSINHTHGSRAARRLALVNPLRAAAGLAPLQSDNAQASPSGNVGWRRHWAFDAARGGYWRSARKNALRAVIAAPWKRENWSCLRYVLACDKPAPRLQPALA